METRELIVFNKLGTRVGKVPIPKLTYLTTEREWIGMTLLHTGELDGIALVVDWANHEITCVRHNE